MLRIFSMFFISFLIVACNEQPKNETTAVQIDSSTYFSQTIESKNVISDSIPKGMVFIPGGTFSMGTSASNESLCSMKGLTSDCMPIHSVYVDPFFMDEHEVTNAEYTAFVKATGYVTVAEQTPTLEEFPGADPSVLKAGSVVFTPPDYPVPLNSHFQWWQFVYGANWKHPYGPASSIKGKDNEPVVHIAWEDAMAYAKWAGKRLPTEAEWEFAARGGKSGQTFTWGNEFKPQQKYFANTFQGSFPNKDTGEDGYEGIAPVKQYPPNGYGLYDISGNVWEWCFDWYHSDYYASNINQNVLKNPKGPESSYDPEEPYVLKKVHRGGSFLCTDQYCSRYIVGTRGKGDWRTGTNHVGFRCVKNVK